MTAPHTADPWLLEVLGLISDLAEKATPEALRGSFLGDIGRIARAAIAKATATHNSGGGNAAGTVPPGSTPGQSTNTQPTNEYMANYYAAARSNYFAVKDEAAFREWALSLGLDVITPDFCNTTADGIRRFGIAVGNHGGSGAWPTEVWDAEANDYVTIDLPARLAPHLAGDEVAVLMEIGNEALRYFTGTAVAVNGSGRTTRVNLDTVYRTARKLGSKITKAMY
jgi:hypothetical protein